MEKTDLNSGTNRPNPMRAGPKLIAVAAKPAADKLQKWVMVLSSVHLTRIIHEKAAEVS
ncbi:hypothetical protein [Jannaschia seosinensis]|uniref:hypothetical protein n=1 Tax=Jannaschia seosinensis TaxID=313367 RepID=UPI00164092FF|nr:hypothetical protein [Jannaschia seosinensis]